MTDITLREKCPNTDFFLVLLQKNTEQKKLRIWTLFTQCYIYSSMFKNCSASLVLRQSLWIQSHSFCKQQKWEMENMKFLKIFISLIFRSRPSEVLKRILVLNIFSIFQENLSCKVYYHLGCFWAPVTGCVWRF